MFCNIRKITVIASISVAFISNLQAELIDYWYFEDVSGKSFNSTAGGIENSGSVGSYWNFGGPGTTMRTDGSGNFEISGHAGQTYRKISPTYDPTTYASGVYRLDLKLTSWNLDDSSNGNLGIELVDPSNNKIAGITIGVDGNDSSKAKIQFASHSTSSTQTGNLAYQNREALLVDNDGISLAVELDYDSSAAKFLVNGLSVREINDFNGAAFTEFKFFTNSNWVAGSTVYVDSMGIEAIPEPSSYATLFGLIVLLTACIRARFTSCKL